MLHEFVTAYRDAIVARSMRTTTDPAFARSTPIAFDVTASDSDPPSGQSQVLAAMWPDLVGDIRRDGRVESRNASRG